MKKLIFLLIVLFPVCVFASEHCETLTVDNTSAGIPFTSAYISNPIHGDLGYASCRLETAQIRFYTDGTAPTSSAGVLLNVGDILNLYTYDDLRKFKSIRTGGTSGSLVCCYKKNKGE